MKKAVKRKRIKCSGVEVTTNPRNMFYNILGLPSGKKDTERVGNQITLVEVSGKFTLNISKGQTDRSAVRFSLVFIEDGKEVNNTEFGQWFQVKSNEGYNEHWFYTPSLSSEYRMTTLWDEVIILRSLHSYMAEIDGIGVSISQGATEYFDFRIPFKKIIRWKDDEIRPTSGNLYMFAQCTVNGTEIPMFQKIQLVGVLDLIWVE